MSMRIRIHDFYRYTLCFVDTDAGVGKAHEPLPGLFCDDVSLAAFRGHVADPDCFSGNAVLADSGFKQVGPLDLWIFRIG